MCLQILRFPRWRPAASYSSVAINDKLGTLLLFLFGQHGGHSGLYLGKIPCNSPTPQGSSLLLLQPLVDGCCLASIDVHFCQYRKGDPVVELAEALDLVVGPRLLSQKLIAGEPQDDKVLLVLFPELTVDTLQALVLGGKAAF